jgi:hypothetical protein
MKLSFSFISSTSRSSLIVSGQIRWNGGAGLKRDQFFRAAGNRGTIFSALKMGQLVIARKMAKTIRGLCTGE